LLGAAPGHRFSVIASLCFCIVFVSVICGRALAVFPNYRDLRSFACPAMCRRLPRSKQSESREPSRPFFAHSSSTLNKVVLVFPTRSLPFCTPPDLFHSPGLGPFNFSYGVDPPPFSCLAFRGFCCIGGGANKRRVFTCIGVSQLNRYGALFLSTAVPFSTGWVPSVFSFLPLFPPPFFTLDRFFFV